MIHVVIGGAGAGKTTYVRRAFLDGELEHVRGVYPVDVTRCGDVVALGLYGIDRREQGTDTIPYNGLPKVLQTIDRLVGEGVKHVVAEGDRINNRRFFQHLIRRGYPFELILVLCPLGVALRRLREAGSSITPQFIKATFQKSRRNYIRYSSKAVRARVVEGA